MTKEKGVFMSKKIFGVLAVIVLALCFSGIVFAAVPTGQQLFTANTTPLAQNESLFITNPGYADTDAEWISIQQHTNQIAKLVEDYTILNVIDVNVYNSDTDALTDPASYAGVDYTFDLLPAIVMPGLQSNEIIEVWHSTDGTVSWTLLGNDLSAVTTNTGFGVFAIAIKKTQQSVDTNPTLPAGQNLYVKDTYDNTSALWQDFDAFIQTTMAANERHTSKIIVDLAVFDTASNSFLTQGIPDGTSYVFLLQNMIADYGQYTKYYYEVYMKSSDKSGWTLLSNDVDSVVISGGIDTIAVVEKYSIENLEISTNPALPQSQSLRVIRNHNSLNAQWQNFENYFNEHLKLAEVDQILSVVELGIYDKNLNEFLPDSIFAQTKYSFPIIEVIVPYSHLVDDYSFAIYKLNESLGSWTYIGNDLAYVEVDDGFGVFAVVALDISIPRTGGDAVLAQPDNAYPSSISMAVLVVFLGGISAFVVVTKTRKRSAK